METARYSIPSLAGSHALQQDLANALVLLDGVGHVDVDGSSGMVLVHFDPQYMDLRTLGYYINGCGYPARAEQPA